MHASLDFDFRAASKVCGHHLTKTQIQGEFREIDVCEPTQTQVEKIRKLSQPGFREFCLKGAEIIWDTYSGWGQETISQLSYASKNFIVFTICIGKTSIHSFVDVLCKLTVPLFICELGVVCLMQFQLTLCVCKMFQL